MVPPHRISGVKTAAIFSPPLRAGKASNEQTRLVRPRSLPAMENPTPTDREQDDNSAEAVSVENHASDDQPRRPHLSIDIPPDHLLTEAEADLTPTPDPDGCNNSTKRSRSRSSTKPQRSPSFMLRQTVKSLLPAGSFNKLFNARIVRTSSLPFDDVEALSSHQQVDKSSATTWATPVREKKAVHMSRSQSLPMNMRKLNTAKSFKRMDSVGGGMFRVVPSTPRVADDIVPTTESEGIMEADGGHEDIPEEEAVCRICMVELSEGSGDTLKLECLCKGELALAHKDCAVKWFSIRGTTNCEVCQQQVRNLPVTLLRLQTMQNRGANNRPTYNRPNTIWQGTPILVIVSILAYFCFLEELLVARNGIAALAISLPFSCILGLFSSLTTTSMVARRYVWIYAAVQFLFVVIFTHLFYGFLHLQAVISIILATFAGFGVGMTGNSIIVEILRWRVRREAPPTDAARRNRRPQQQQPALDQQTSSQPSASANNQGQSNAVDNPAVAQA